MKFKQLNNKTKFIKEVSLMTFTQTKFKLQ